MSDFRNCENFGNLEIFQHFFIFAKNPQISKFKKICVLEEPLRNVCTKLQVIPFINVVFIAF